MKISDKAKKKSLEIQKQIIENNEKEMEMQMANDFAEKYGICPQCAVPLVEVKKSLFRRSFQMSITSKHEKICKKCGSKFAWYDEPYY